MPGMADVVGPMDIEPTPEPVVVCVALPQAVAARVTVSNSAAAVPHRRRR
jgi:hypothetical protein